MLPRRTSAWESRKDFIARTCFRFPSHLIASVGRAERRLEVFSYSSQYVYGYLHIPFINASVGRDMDRELERSGTVATREAKKSLLSQPQHLHYMMLRGAGGKHRFLHHHQSQFSSLRPREDVLRNVRSKINNFYKLPSIILHIIRQHVIAICFGNIFPKKHQIHGYQSEIIRTSFVINSPDDIS